MAIKTNQNGKWVNVYGSSIEVKRNVSIDTTLTKAGWAAEAKSVGKKIGELNLLNTTTKTNLVSAINELVAKNSGDGQISVIEFDLETSKASHTRDQILELITPNPEEDRPSGHLILGKLSTGEVLTFIGINTFQSEDTLAIFENTSIDDNNTTITTFYTVDKDAYFTLTTYEQGDPFRLESKVGQVMVVKEVDKVNGFPLKWEPKDAGQADNGIIIISVSESAADKDSTYIREQMEKGSFILALYKNEYYPLLKIIDNQAIFYIAEVSAGVIKGKTLTINSDLSIQYVETTGAELQGYIKSPNSGKIGQILAVKTVDEGNYPTSWETVDLSFPPIPDAYIVPTFNLYDLGLPAIKVNGSIVKIENIDTTELITKLMSGPINIIYKYFINDIEQTVQSVATSLAISDANVYTLTCVDNIHTSQNVILTFIISNTSITGQAKTINVDLSNYIQIPNQTPEADQYLKIQSVDADTGTITWSLEKIPQADNKKLGLVKAIAKTDAMTTQVGIDANGFLWTQDIASPNELPEYSAEDQNKYVTPNEDGKLTWKDIPKGIPDYSAENKNQYITANTDGNLEWKDLPIDKTLQVEGSAADAKTVGDRLTALETKGSGSFFVIIQDDKTCSHTFEQIVTAIDNGFSVIAIYNNIYIPLTQYTKDELVLFYITTIIDGELTGLFISITPSQTVNIMIEKIQIATPQQAGLVKPSVEWSADMKSSVSVDTSGGLWFKTDKTLQNENEAADAAQIGSEITRLEGLIEEAKVYAGFIVTQDDKGNVTIVAMSPWVVSNSDEDDGNVVITSV